MVGRSTFNGICTEIVDPCVDTRTRAALSSMCLQNSKAAATESTVKLD